MHLGRTPRELLAAVSSAELTELLAWWRLEPWGEHRADLRAGVVAAMLHNVHVSRGRPAQPEDFVLYGAPRRRRSPAEVAAAIKAHAAAQRAVRRKHG